jgi:hypothetical protein
MSAPRVAASCHSTEPPAQGQLAVWMLMTYAVQSITDGIRLAPPEAGGQQEQGVRPAAVCTWQTSYRLAVRHAYSMAC